MSKAAEKLQARKKQLEDAVRDLCVEFEKETGLSVKVFNIRHKVEHGRYVVDSVNIHIVLNSS